MSEFITLSCPSCGHKLQITEDIDRFACAECENEYIVIRKGGIVALKPVINDATTSNENIIHQLFSRFTSDLKQNKLTPEQLKDSYEWLHKLEKELDDIREAEAKQKAEDSTEKD